MSFFYELPCHCEEGFATGINALAMTVLVGGALRSRKQLRHRHYRVAEDVDPYNEYRTMFVTVGGGASTPRTPHPIVGDLLSRPVSS